MINSGVFKKLFLSCLAVFAFSFSAPEEVMAQCAIGQLGGPSVFYEGCTETTGSATNTTIANPAGTTIGDVLIVSIVTDGNSSPVPAVAAGWNLIDSNNSVGAVTQAVYSRTATAGGGATHQFNFGANERFISTFMRFTGTDEASIVSGFVSGSSTQPQAPTANTVLGNSLVVRLTGVDRRIVALNGGLTNINTGASGGGSGGVSTAIGFVNQPLAGATGTYNFSTITSDQWRAGTIALKPPEPPVAFKIEHSGTGSTCSITNVTITAVDASGATVPSFTGQVNITAPNGDWSTVSVANAGSFANDNPGNGDFTYTFTAGDAGDIVVAYAPTVAGSLNIDIEDNATGLLTENSDPQGVDQQMTVGLCGFTLSHDGSMGTCSAFEEITLTAVEPDGSTVRTNYNGTVRIDTNIISGSPVNGTWSIGTASGTITVIDGNTIEYTFDNDAGDGDAADNGQVVLHFSSANVQTVNFDLFDTVEPAVDADLGLDPDLAVLICGFSITHDGDAGVCGYEEITLSSTDPLFTGTVYIETTTANGTWSIVSGEAEGILTDLGSGNISYDFHDTLDGSVVTLRFTDTTTESVSFNIYDDMIGGNDAQVGADLPLNVGACTFIIAPPMSGDNCSIQTITLTIADPGSNPVLGYVGPLTLTTSTNLGDWLIGTGNGTLANLTPGDGVATYQFDAADNGTVDLGFTHDDPGSVTIDANDAGNSITTSVSPAFTITACAFRVSFTDMSDQGNTCSPKSITIEVRNGAGDLITNYSGAVTLDTSTANGDWAENGGTLGTFTNNGNGSADYTFVAGDNGVITLDFSNIIVETTNFTITDGLLVIDASYDPDLVISACRFIISHSGTTDICTPEAVTFSLVDPDDNPITNYEGQIFISTTPALGSWTDSGLNTNTLTPTGGSTTTYQFDAADNGTATFNFQGNTIAAYDIDVTDGSNTEVDMDLVEDPQLDITSCLPTVTDFSCIEGNSTSVTIPDGALTGNSRAVVMVTGYEGTTAIANTTFDAIGVNTSGTQVIEAFNNDQGANTRTYTEMWAWLDADLPSSAGTYTGSFNADSGQAMCLISLQNVDQVFPAVAATGSSVGNSGGVISSSLTPPADNSIVISGASVDELGGFGVNTLGTLIGSFSVATDSWSFGVGSGTVAGTGTITVTENFFGGNDRYSHVIAAFGPAPAPLSYFTITHDGTSTSCTQQSVTITAYDVNGNIKTDYEGTVTLGTDLNHGNWSQGAGLGVLTDTPVPGDDDGAATYQFAAGDAGVATISFSNPHNETIDFSVADGSIIDDGSHAALVVSSCLPVLGDTQCYVGTSGSVTIVDQTISDSRAVILSIARESIPGNDPAIDPTSVVFGFPQPTQTMTFVASEKNTDAGNTLVNTTEMYVIFDADLPTAGGAYSASFSEFSGTFPNTPSMCLTAVYGVEQSVPVSPATNSTSVDGGTAVTTSVTTASNNALVMSIVSDDRTGGTYTSTQSNMLWNNETPSGTIVFAGSAGYKAQSGPASDTMTASGATNIISHVMAAFSPVIPGPPTADEYVPVTLFKTWAGPLNYRAYGNTFRTESYEGDDCAMGTSSNITVSDIPMIANGHTYDSQIVSAYVYWAASGDDQTQVDNDVTITDPGLTGHSISADDTFLVLNGGAAGRDFFTGYKDITSIFTGNGTYTMSDLTIQNGAPWTAFSCVGAWSLIVVYENFDEDIKVINLFHGFQPFQNSTFELVPRNFRIAGWDGTMNLYGLPHGQLTHITVEGDEQLSGAGELFELQSIPGSPTFNDITNPYNPLDNQYNSTVTRPTYNALLQHTGTYTIDLPTVGAPPRVGDTWGIDVDTHYLAGTQVGDPLYEFAIAAERPEQITTRYGSGQDQVFLIAEVISITNEPIVDIEVTKSEVSSFVVGGTSSYTISIINNGDGNGLGGSATGFVTVTDTMPTGLTITGVSATGWSCANTAAALACEYDIATTYPVALPEGASLPDITVEVSIADEVTFPDLVNQVDNVARALYSGGNCLPDSLDTLEPTFGQSPDPADCDVSPEFDNVQDLEGGAFSMNDLIEKSVSNNNVDGVATTINGRQTDLQITKAVAGVLQENSAGTYTITVTNLGPDSVTKQVTVTDTLPAGLTYQGYLETGDDDLWSCGAVGQDVTCTTSVVLAPAETADVLLGVTLGAPAVENATVNNTANVSVATGNFDTNAANDSDTDSSTVQGEPVAAQNKFLISVNLDGTTLGGLSFNKDDIILYDPDTDTATMFYEDAALLDGIEDINALHVRKNGQIIISPLTGTSTIGMNVLNFEPGDLAVYDPILDTATLLFDGSAIFTGGSENIDAVYEQDNELLVISTVDAADIGGVAFGRGDWVEYNPTGGTIDGLAAGAARIILDGDSGAVFNADVQLNGTYFKIGTPTYVITIGQTTANIATGNTTVTGDDIASYELGADSQLEFRGSIPNGVFSPLLSTRFIDGVHVVEDGYFGHFSIVESVSGNTCTPTTVVISKHDINSVIETDYTGSIHINTDNTATWSIISGSGTLQPTGQPNQYVYTFVPGDLGEVTLALTVPSASTINVDVTNGLVVEDPGEDPNIVVNDQITAVTYGDDFSSGDFSRNSGTSSWEAGWEETDPDVSGPVSGNVFISGGEAYFDNQPFPVTNGDDDNMPALIREVDLGLYPSGTLTLTFDWRTVSVNVGDSFVVEARGDKNTDAWLTVDTFTGLSGTNSGAESYDLTTLLDGSGQAVSGDTQVRFRVDANYNISGNFIIDNVLLTTSTTSCGVGSVHHYDISFPDFPDIGPFEGVMCEAYRVRFTAHDIAHTPVAPTLGTVVNMSTNLVKGSWSDYPGFTATNDLPPLGDGIGQYTFGLNQTFFDAYFNFTNPVSPTETINLNITDGAHIEDIDPSFVFNQSGFLFKQSNDPLGSNIGTQIAGKNSTTAPLSPIYILAVDSTDVGAETLACTALLGGQTIQMELQVECDNPTTCASNTLTVNGQVVDAENSYAPPPTGNPLINVTFEPDGSSELNFNYPDAGRIALHADYQIPLANISNTGNPGFLSSGNYMSGSSNLFVVRPFGVSVDLENSVVADSAELTAVDHNGTVFRSAGEDFLARMRAFAYDESGPDLDTDDDGFPDPGSDTSVNALTPNFGREVIPESMTLSVNLVLPSTTTIGVTLGGTPDYFTDGLTGGEQENTVNWPEVGIIDLLASLNNPGGYLDTGAIFADTIQNVGRFVPDHYNLSNISFNDRSDILSCAMPTFTYMDEEMGIMMDVEARNVFGDRTRYYMGDFVKLDQVSQLGFGAVNDLDELTSRLDTTGINISWGDELVVGMDDTGTGQVLGTIILMKNPDMAAGPDEDGPFRDFQVGIIPNDNDHLINGINDGNTVDNLLNMDVDAVIAAMTDLVLLGDTDILYGRLVLNDASGSEISISSVAGIGNDAEVTVELEYWDGDSFVISTDDDCTPINSSALDFVANSYFDIQNPPQPLVNANDAAVQPMAMDGIVSNGQTNVNSTAPGEDVPMYISSPNSSDDLAPVEGLSALIELDLDALGLGYLKYNWRGTNPGNVFDETPDDSDVEDNPRAFIDFGTFQGHDRVINWQEILLTP